jgi:hypothetical protein
MKEEDQNDINLAYLRFLIRLDSRQTATEIALVETLVGLYEKAGSTEKKENIKDMILDRIDKYYDIIHQSNLEKAEDLDSEFSAKLLNEFFDDLDGERSIDTPK